MSTRFFILVTQRNAEPFIRRCLDSIQVQTYKNYEVVIMDDASTDGTWEIIQQYPFQAIQTPKQPYHCKNFVTAINTFAQQEDVICFVSGDDWLAGEDVLQTLAEVYEDSEVWLTYGSFMAASGTWGAGYCREVRNTRTYRRREEWCTSHLITCRKRLWDRIRPEDLLYEGHYPNNSFDHAFMFPMVEMAGQKHTRFIEKTLYIYNDNNPVAQENFRRDPAACGREAKYWRRQKQYEELKEL